MLACQETAWLFQVLDDTKAFTYNRHRFSNGFILGISEKRLYESTASMKKICRLLLLEMVYLSGRKVILLGGRKPGWCTGPGFPWRFDPAEICVDRRRLGIQNDASWRAGRQVFYNPSLCHELLEHFVPKDHLQLFIFWEGAIRNMTAPVFAVCSHSNLSYWLCRTVHGTENRKIFPKGSFKTRVTAQSQDEKDPAPILIRVYVVRKVRKVCCELRTLRS